MSGPAAINVRELVKDYGKLRAPDGLSLLVELQTSSAGRRAVVLVGGLVSRRSARG